ncbi:MAG: hypothetical protein F6K41_14740 [Symploca sp. SIO3E6]|nr:hypothetical protein [Caldora sp. SIO3E6]
MGNGEWGMGNGEWGMGNGEWRMENGGTRGRRKTFTKDKGQTTNNKQQIACNRTTDFP